MKKYLSIAIAGILALSAPSIAKAQFTITANIGGVPTVSGVTLENFDEPTPSILTLSGAAWLTTGTSSEATAPYFSGSTAGYFSESPTYGYDNSQYVAVNGGTARLSFSTPQYYLGLLWASVDANNHLTFYGSANNIIGTVSGQDLPGVLTPAGTGPNGTFYVNIISTTAFSSVVATANDSFEFDDVAYSPVPEPASLSLLAFGMFGLTLLRRHQR